MKNIFYKNKKNLSTKGFTLVELLVVIAILGVLAAAVLTAINPLEQLARGRDSGRKSSVSQLGHSVQAYFTSQSAGYPTANASWMTTLKNAGEIKILPTAPAPVCTIANAEGGFCYNTNGTDAIIYVPAESISEKTRAACAAGQGVFIVWSSAAGNTGTACTTSAATPPAVGITGLK